MNTHFSREIRGKYTAILQQRYGKREAENIWRAIVEDADWEKVGDRSRKQKKLGKMVEAIISGRPVQYVTGKAHFYGRVFDLGEAVLIPRPETEEVVYECLKVLDKNKPQKVLDIGTGSGCIAITIALERPHCRVVAVDVSEDALRVAKNNARKLGADVEFRRLDFLKEPVDYGSEFDLIVSNPPYVSRDEVDAMTASTVEYEPEIALFPGGDDCLVFYKKIAENAHRMLKAGGRVVVELNEFRAEEVRAIFEEKTASVLLIKDMQGKKRILRARF
ncbi:MAG: peptide chain release factor N(5)-glutamine methyltransferase [Saprospirales bacterium]|nr:MAG: peptide chain release factor N(5)-glutamine methyltransferase [Saprospirales bacterium]